MARARSVVALQSHVTSWQGRTPLSKELHGRSISIVASLPVWQHVGPVGASSWVRCASVPRHGSPSSCSDLSRTSRQSACLWMKAIFDISVPPTFPAMFRRHFAAAPQGLSLWPRSMQVKPTLTRRVAGLLSSVMQIMLMPVHCMKYPAQPTFASTCPAKPLGYPVAQESCAFTNQEAIQ
jgi:hypothetical protein